LLWRVFNRLFSCVADSSLSWDDGVLTVELAVSGVNYCWLTVVVSCGAISLVVVRYRWLTVVIS
jgi:hypothetical protein